MMQNPYVKKPSGPPSAPYEAMSSVGSAKSTENGRQTAITVFSAFLRVQDYPKWNDFTQDWVCGKVLENGSLSNPSDPPISKVLAEFCTYLLKPNKNVGNTESHYKAGSQVQYFSSPGMRRICLFADPKLNLCRTQSQPFRNLMPISLVKITNSKER